VNRPAVAAATPVAGLCPRAPRQQVVERDGLRVVESWVQGLGVML